VKKRQNLGVFTKMVQGISSSYAYGNQMSSVFEMTLDPEICRNDPLKVTRAIFRYFNTNFFQATMEFTQSFLEMQKFMFLTTQHEEGFDDDTQSGLEEGDRS
jgi:hypothetical protein